MKSKYVPELDGVRGIACLGIILSHCLLGILVLEKNSFAREVVDLTLPLLLGGVPLFFVLSGFLIGGILLDSRGEEHYFKVFWIRRIARIFPVCYLLVGTYALALFLNTQYGGSQLDLWALAEPRPPIWSYLTFTQSFWLAANGYGGPGWVGITWSLAIEEQFYFLFPFAAYFLSRRSVTALAIAAILLTPVFRIIADQIYPDWYGAYVLLPCRADNLMCGVLVAIIVRNPRALAIAIRYRMWLDLAIAVMAVSVATDGFIFDLIPSHNFSYSVIAWMFGLLILRIFLYRRSRYNSFLRNQLLAKIGLISYALYMYHQAVNGTVHAFLFSSAPRIENWQQFLAALFVIAVSTALATISYFVLERPIRRFAHRFSENLQKRSTSSQPLGAAAPGE